LVWRLAHGSLFRPALPLEFLSLFFSRRLPFPVNNAANLLIQVSGSGSSGEAVPQRRGQSLLQVAKAHWPEYLMESAELGLFMVSACVVTTLLYHPDSPVLHWIGNPFVRMALTGLAMAATLLLLIHSPWGKQSGAHMNPAMTLMFFRLHKIELWDAVFYMIFQFLGGLAGVLLSFVLLGQAVAHHDVNFAATQPGRPGVAVAFIAELVISLVLATTVLLTSNDKALSRFTPYCAALLVATYITFEAPISGMSMNPARTLASAVPAQAFHSIWIYFTAPPLGMLIASELYLRFRSAQGVYCAKYHHNNRRRCIFRCRYAELQGN
jgi:aquaporin Z